MNKFVKEIRRIVLDAKVKADDLKEAQKVIDEAITSGRISQNTYDEKVAEIKVENESIEKAHNQLVNLQDEYIKALDEWVKLKADNLTDDVKLFNSPLELSDTDYKELEVKHSDNYSMLKVIKDHAKKNKVNYQSKYSINKDEKLAMLSNQLITPAINIINSLFKDSDSGYLVALWSNEDKFNDIYEDLSRMTQTE